MAIEAKLRSLTCILNKANGIRHGFMIEFRRRYPKHKRIDYVDFRVALSFYKRAPKTAQRDQRYTEQAVREWSDFIQKHPDSSFLVESTEKQAECINRLAKELEIAKFYKQRQAWEAVRRRAEYLIMNYPTSDMVTKALSLKIQAHGALNQLKERDQAISQLQAIDPARAEALKDAVKQPPKK